MFIKLFGFVAVLMMTVRADAQTSLKIKGTVIDTSLNIPLANTSISILNKTDSTFVTSVRANTDGNFLITNLKNGDYLLIAAFPGYTESVENIHIDFTTSSLIDKKIVLIPLPKLLKEVIVTSRKQVVIRGDTLEYDANAYSIQPNGKVEDLIKQLPGIQVDKDGRITAQGQRVKKVLVDGEEFFGDDPTLVTRNIRGDMVDKVQIYDKKSDQVALSGGDLAKGSKTIDIKLKEESKNGMFGNANAGTANEGYFQTQTMINRFKGAEKFAFYGIAGNTGNIGLSSQETITFASPNNSNVLSTSSAVFGSYTLDSFKYDGQGIPLAFSSGLHYDNRWNEKRQAVNVNYKFGSLNVDGNATTISQINIPSGKNVSNTDEQFNTKTSGHKLDSRFETKLDSNTTLFWYINTGLQNSKSLRKLKTVTTNESNEQLNSVNRILDDEADFKLFQTSVILNKKMKKKGRTLSLSVDQTFYKDDKSNLLNAESSYFAAKGNTDSILVINQRKSIIKTYESVNSNLVYSEPISGKISLFLSYNFNYAKGESSYISYNRSPNSSYNIIDSLYSGVFDLTQLTNQVGAQISVKGKKQSFSGGGSAMMLNFDQLDNFSNTKLKRNFFNFNPKLNWTYSISSQTSLRLNYSGAAILPTIDQIQPVRINSDPLNIIVGNAELNPSFKHNIDGIFNSYNMVSGRTVIISTTTSVIFNNITSDVNTNAAGQSFYRFVNLKNKVSTNNSGYIYLGGKIKSLNMPIGVYLNLSKAKYYNNINGEINESKISSASLYLNASKSITKRYSLDFEGGPSYNSSSSSVNNVLSTKGWGLNLLTSYVRYLPSRLELSSDINYSYLPSTSIFANDFSRAIFNAGIRKKFLKTENLILGFAVNDLLNQNRGLIRNTALNSIYQKTYDTIRRYYMLSLKYELNKM